MTILGLTMVPPILLGSLQTVARFRKDWTKGLSVLRQNLLSGATRVRPSTPFIMAAVGGSAATPPLRKRKVFLRSHSMSRGGRGVVLAA